MKKKLFSFSDLSNRTLYSLISIFLVISIAAGVYAFGTNNPSNFGHSFSELEQPCSNGQILKVSSGVWACGTDIDTDTNTDTNYWAGPNSDGNIQYDGGVIAEAYYYLSDEALKENIQIIEGAEALEKINSLQGISFDWKDSGESSIGFIAQDVENVYPQLVMGSNGYKSVAYANIVAVLVEAMKEQQKQIDSLKEQIEELKFQENLD